MEQVVYKVVYNDPYRNKYTSANQCIRDNILDYAIGETTKPKILGSKIFVFDTLENAQFFLRNMCWWYNRCILKCYATGVTKLKSRPSWEFRISEFWRTIRSKKSRKHLRRIALHKGTLLAETVTPFEVVQ